MSDEHDDEQDPAASSDKVKKAMSRKRPVKGKATLSVIEGGKGDERPEPPPHDDMPEEGDVDDAGDDFGDDFERPAGMTENERIIAQFCALMDQNDRDNGRRLIAWFGEHLAYVTGLGWLVWRGSHWLRDDADLDVRLMAQMIVDKIKLEAIEIEASDNVKKLLDLAAKALKKSEGQRTDGEKDLIARAIEARKALSVKKSKRRAWAVTSGNAGKTGAMLQQAQSLKSMAIEKLDTDHMRFNVANGTLRFWRERDPDQEDGGKRMIGRFEFLPHDRNDMITKIAEVTYNPDATCPFFEEHFLKKVQPSAEMRLFLQVSTAYALLIGGNSAQRLFYHYGTGANGKSAFLELIGRMAGSYRSVASPDTITGDSQRAGQQANPDIARLHNTRVVTIEELPKNVPLREELIKALTGGTKILARFLNRDFFEFMPIFTPLLSGNSKPAISGSDYGIWRRVLLVLWGVTIPVAERLDPVELEARLDAERSGILNWLIDGIVLYLEKGLDAFVPAEVTAFTQDYREERNNVGVFAEKCLIAAPGAAIQAGPLFKAYEEWCGVNGLTAAKQRSFGDTLNQLGFKKTRDRLYMYQDIRLDTSWKFDPQVTPAPPIDPQDPGFHPSQM